MLVRCLIKGVLILGISAATFTASRAGDMIVLGYYMAWSKSTLPHTAVPYDQLTHIAHAFVWPKPDGSLDTYSYFHYPQLVQRARDENKKVIVSVGGWGNSDGFGPMSADDSSRARFVREIVAFCLDNGYDGIDLDWEYPGSADRQNFVKLVQELRDAFSELEDPFSISIALPSSDWRNGYNIQALRDLIDYFGVMTYDFHGSWSSHSGHNSPLYQPSSGLCQDGSLHQSANYYLSRGVPRAKLVVGAPSYGRRFNTAELYQPPTSSTNNGAAVSYADAVGLLGQGWTYHWDDVSKVPFLRNSANTQIISFDDTVSFRHKAEYVKDNDLRGVKVWALGYDNTGSGHHLMETLATHLSPVTGVTEHMRDTPVTFGLLQNYPNPFNSATVIGYRLTVNGFVTLKVYDILGREVRTLVEEEQSPGIYEVEFNIGANHEFVPTSGVYFYRLEAANYIAIRKMTLLK
jgi:chitinase